MTKAEIQKNNDELREKVAAYEALGSPLQIAQRLQAAEEAMNTNAMIRKLLA